MSIYFPHPVLAAWTGDYPGGEFSLATNDTASLKNGEFKIFCKYELKSTLLQALISENKAYFAAEVKSSWTNYRILCRQKTHTSAEDILIADSDSLAGNTIITPYILAASDITLPLSPEHHQDYFGGPIAKFEIPEASILAIGTGAEVEGDYRTPSSAIDLVSSDGVDPGEFGIDYDEQRIQIQVNPVDRQNIENLRHNSLESDTKALWPSLFLTAITGALQRLEEYSPEDYAWVEIVKNTIKRENYDDISQEELQEKALFYAQKLLNAPLGAMLQGFERRRDV